MKNRITVFTKILLDIMFIGGIVAIVTLPLSVRLYGKINTYFRENYAALIVLFGISGVFAELIITELRRIFRTVMNDDCFVRENVTSLSRMGTYSFIIAAVTAVRLLLYLTPAVLVVIIVFIIAGLFSKVLAGVFDRAVTYKLDNDLTI